MSLTSHIIKLFESMIYDKLFHFLSLQHIISETQHGFCHGKFCFTNLIKSYNDWTLAVDVGWKVDILYLDYRKEFDSVPHMCLLRKLKSYGITGKILTGLRSFNFRVMDIIMV